MYYGNLSEALNNHKALHQHNRMQLMAEARFHNWTEIQLSSALSREDSIARQGAIALAKAWRRHYGLSSKYRGDGTQRTTTEVQAIALSIKTPGDWLEV